MNKKIAVIFSVIIVFLISSCDNTTEPSLNSNNDIISLNKKSSNSVSEQLNSINDKLELEGANVRVAYAELLLDGNSKSSGQTTYFSNVGNKQLGHHWVPGDPQRGNRENITWITDGTQTSTEAGDAIARAMDTWQNAQCSEIPLTDLGTVGIDLGYVEYLIGFGGFAGFTADLTHAGWLPGFVFDFLFGPGSGVLGVTYTFVWTVPDIDNNRKSDVAFREIYYNDAYSWSTDGSGIDIETVALHEAGHGLSQGHFGKVSRTLKNNKLHFSPKAVMNAGYSGIQRELTGTDNAGHCSIWGSWPNN